MASLPSVTCLGKEQLSMTRTATTQEQATKKHIASASQGWKDTHAPTAASAHGVDMGSACGPCAHVGNGPLTNPTTWPFVGPSCDVHSCMGFLPQAYPAPWAYTWVPWGTSLWTARPPPVPSVWSRDASGSLSCMSNQHPATLASGLAPYFRGPPAPDSSVPPTLAGDVLSCCPQEGHETPASSAPRSVVGDPSRGASYPKKCQAPLSECTFSFGPIWAPWSPSSPELHHLPPSPIQDPQSPPRSPSYSQRSPCRARRCLFEP